MIRCSRPLRSCRPSGKGVRPPLLRLAVAAVLCVSGQAEAQGFPYPGNRPSISVDRGPSPGQMASLESLGRRSVSGLRIRWDGETGSPAMLSGDLSRPFAGAASEAALRFVADEAGLFFRRPPEAGRLADPARSPLRVERTIRRRDREHVRLLQFHEGLPVHRGGYTVNLVRQPGPGGGVVRQVVSVLGRIFEDIPATMDLSPSIPAEEAAGTALSAVGPPDEGAPRATNVLLVYPLGGRYHLAWEVKFSTEDPLGIWSVYIDAQGGGVLEVQNRLPHGKVSGRVYLHNPVRDGGLADLPFPNAYVTRQGETVVTDASGNYDDAGSLSVSTELSGPFTRVYNADGAEATYIGAPDVLWTYPTGDTHFDEINVFYHINVFHDFVHATLGFSGVDIRLPATVHYGVDYDNAFYDGFMIAFGDGDGFFTGTFAQDDVIYHEYGHFLQDRAVSMGYGFNEVGGMNEGYADYFAGAFSGDSAVGEALFLAGGALRDLDNKGLTPPRIYPDYLIQHGYEPHAGGEVWGGGLWDIRKVIGGAVADPIAFEALFYLPPDPGFLDGREALVEADIQLSGGVNKPIIEQLLFERGIGDVPDPDPFVRLVAEPSAGPAPLPVLFRGVAVGQGVIQNYSWDLGDGTVIPSGGSMASHVYNAPGVYTATLLAVDDMGATAAYSAQVTVGLPGEIVVCPKELDVGFVCSDEPFRNSFGDDDVFAGFLSGLDYRGAILYDIPVIPGGTSGIVIDTATVEFLGQDDSAKAPLGGTWSLKLLSAEADALWRNQGYNDIVGALPLIALDPPLGNADLTPGLLNAFSVTKAQLPALQERIAIGTLSFRMDGPYGVNNLFSWDSGYDRFGEDPGATRTKPVLRITYSQTRLAGDVDGDGVVDAADASAVAAAVVGNAILSDEQEVVADVDRDGTVDERDAISILARAAGVVDF